MKSHEIIKVILILLALSGMTIPISAQGTGYRISDTLVAGDTTIIRYQLADYDPHKLSAVLDPWDLYFPPYGPYFNNDTIRSFKVELYDNQTFDFYFAVPLGILPGEYRMFIYYEELYVETPPLLKWIYTPPYILENPQGRIICEGDSAEFYVRAFGNHNWDLWYQWYHNNMEISSSNDGYFFISFTQLQDTGNYYCVVANNFGADTSDIVRLELTPVPANPGPPVGPGRFCPGIEITEYWINSDPLATGYDWHLFPEEAGTVQQHDTSFMITWDTDYSGIAELYVELVSGKCGSTSSDILYITVSGQSAPMEICIVGIDEETGKYRIVWEKSGYESAELYRIYRESNQADVYLEIGTVDPDELGVFVDPASVPDMLSHRYKISYTDSCGNESELSAYHQTMHLAANLGTNNVVNLAWSEYKGIPFPAYNIYRGNHPDSMSLLIQVPSTVTAFTDNDPPYGTVYYQVGMSNPSGCNPDKKSGPDYSSSRSNMEEVNISGIKEINENKLFTIYPNPAEKELQIRLKEVFTVPIQYTVYNPLGSIVLGGMLWTELNSIDVSSLSSGLYIFKLSADRKAYYARFVINKKNYYK